jgi:uncharacterized protein
VVLARWSHAVPSGTRVVTPDTKGDAVKIDDWLLEILVCPKCHSPVRVDEEASELVCTGADCGLAYPVRDDIPVMLVDEARDPAKG